MPPNNQYTPQPPQPNYDFIMNPNQPKRMNSFFDGSPKSLFIMIGAALGIIILIFIVYQIFKPVGLTPQLTQLAQSQAEIARVAGLADESAVNQTTKNLGASVTASLTTHENELVDLLATSGTSLSSETLAAGNNPATDEKLDTATKASNFDAVFTQVLTKELKDYQGQLNSIYNHAKSETLKLELKNDFSDVNLLLEQAKQSD